MNFAIVKTGVLSFLCLTLVIQINAQDSLKIPASSLFYNLKAGDSVTVYQCRVIDPSFENDKTQYTPATLYTVTEKIVIKKIGNQTVAERYDTHIRDLPNRKFSGLKIRERPYWLFVRKESFELSDVSLEKIVRLERAGREAMEYDYPVSKHSRNQLIIKRGKNFRQLLYGKPVSAAELLR